jgi:hypothetical protein
MRRLDRTSTLLIVTICVVLGCTAVLVREGGWRRDLRSLAHSSEAADPAYRMVVVFRPEDCEGRLDFVHLVAQPRFRNALTVTGILVGTASAGRLAKQRLRARGLELPLVVRRRGLSLTTQLGYSSTPYLLLMDREGQVRFAMPTPRTPGDMAELEQAMRVLISRNDDAAS